MILPSLKVWRLGSTSSNRGYIKYPFKQKIVMLNQQNMNDDKTIVAPRSLAILVIQYCGLVPLFIAISTFLAIITSHVSFTSEVFTILMILVGLPLAISFFMFYFPQKYITLLKINEEENILEKIKKGQIIQKIELNSVKGITSKWILAAPCSYKLFVDNIDDSSFEILNEYNTNIGTHWERFSEKLSTLTKKPLIKEIWKEDFDGKLSLVSPETIDTIKYKRKQQRVYIIITIFISSLGAVYFKIFPSTKALLFAGLVTVLINIALSFYYVLRNRKDFGKLSNNAFVLVIYVLTLLIPFISFYIMFVFLLNGFQLM